MGLLACRFCLRAFPHHPSGKITGVVVFGNAPSKNTSACSYRISCFRFRWMIMSCTEPMVILSRLVSVALVKWP